MAFGHLKQLVHVRRIARKFSIHRLQVFTGLLAFTVSVLSFQNCSPTMAPCDGSDCAATASAGKSSSSSGSTTLGSTAPNGSTTGSTSTSSGGTLVLPTGGTSTGGTSYTGTSTGGSSTGGTVIGTGSTSTGTSGSTTTTNTAGLYFRIQPRSATIDEGDYFQLSAYALAGTQEATYQWYKNGAAIPNAITATWDLQNVLTSASGEYFVEARVGTTTIRSETAVLKVRPLRNACPAGWYGSGPTTPANTWEHESVITRYYANKYQLGSELQDSYNLSVACTPAGWGQSCSGTKLYECRNAKLFLVQDACICMSGN